MSKAQEITNKKEEVPEQPLFYNKLSFGGKINLGNYSAVDIALSLAVPSEENGDIPEAALAQAGQIARRVMGSILLDVITMPEDKERQEAITAAIPSYLQATLKINPFAIWLIEGAIEFKQEALVVQSNGKKA